MPQSGRPGISPSATTTANSVGRVTAVLGPTNTGKTYLAMERMLGHRSGMIGFPLRLLARENYDRIVAAKGPGCVALITGEEMIVPPRPHYFVCTVEAMPVDRPVAFLAVDEIQLCADPERGHIFTDRLLYARGLEETMFLGAETIRPLIQALVPRIDIVTRPRFSALSYAGHKKVTRLPPRSAVVAFSATDVYAIAEVMRRQRGGTAVVLGALSPRTRNAQVELYQSGDVDYLVATDAIGMGLNLDVGHVAFARLTKFDGHSVRRLSAPEIGQIAGRAGRHRRDGTFGTTSDLNGMSEDVIDAVEEHRFDTLKRLMWRNHDLRFESIDALLRSLARKPVRPELYRVGEADDHLALATLARDSDIAARAQGIDAVSLLWDVCRIPDFRKVLSDAHTRLLGQIYRYLSASADQGAGRLPEDWVANQVARLDRTEGDIDTLVTRIAHIRTWTYVSHRPSWLQDASHWRERTRAIEDKLSDALHERLTQRFVDRRSTLMTRSLRENGTLLSAVRPDGQVIVEGHAVGDLRGFQFIPDTGTDGDDKTVIAAARRALQGELARRVAALEKADATTISLDASGTLTWDGVAVARLKAGRTLETPAIAPLTDAWVDSVLRDRIKLALESWSNREVATGLAPLTTLEQRTRSGPARGLIYRVREGLGDCLRSEAESLIRSLSTQERTDLLKNGLKLGIMRVYAGAMVKPAAVAWRGLLWCLHNRWPLPAPIPPAGRISIGADPNVPASFYAAIGYPVVGPRAIRTDILERFLRALRRDGPKITAENAGRLAPLIGCSTGEIGEILVALDYRRKTAEDGTEHWVPARNRRSNRPKDQKTTKACPVTGDSPFEKLKEMALTQ